jgi:hypothetical protein
MKSKKRMLRGQTVEIRFLDHCETDGPALEFVVYGRVAAVCRRSVTIDAWAYVDLKESDRTNVASYTIVRSAITRWWRLKRE